MESLLTAREIAHSLNEAIDDFETLLEGADESASVATCPGWNVRDLTVHVGTVYRWAAAVVLSSDTPKKPVPIIEKPLHEWFRLTADALLAALAAVEPSEPTPNFSGVFQQASFWNRRMLHETLVHQNDLSLALSRPELPIRAQVAADGIAEVIGVYFRRLAAQGNPPDVRENIRIHATDTGDTWVLVPEEVGVLHPPSTPATASVSGTALDLYLGLWGREANENRLHCEGDAARALLAGPTST